MIWSSSGASTTTLSIASPCQLPAKRLGSLAHCDPVRDAVLEFLAVYAR